MCCAVVLAWTACDEKCIAPGAAAASSPLSSLSSHSPCFFPYVHAPHTWWHRHRSSFVWFPSRFAVFPRLFMATGLQTAAVSRQFTDCVTSSMHLCLFAGCYRAYGLARVSLALLVLCCCVLSQPLCAVVCVPGPDPVRCLFCLCRISAVALLLWYTVLVVV